MNEWNEIILGDYISTNIESITNDYPYKKIFYLVTGSITSGRIEELKKILLSEAPSRARRIVRENDIIYSSVRPNQRHYGFISNPLSNLVVSTGFIVITCEATKLFPKYLYYFLTSDRSVEYLHTIAEGSTSAYPSLKPSDIESLKIYLPPLAEQHVIANALSALDDKIDLLHRQNETLEALAQTLFRQWFIEEAEDDWKEGKVRDIADHIKNNVKPHNSPGELYHHYSIPAFDNDKIAIKEFGRDIKSNKYEVPANSILISKLNPRFPRVWRIGNEIPPNSICSTEFQIVLPKKPGFYGFIYCFLKSRYVTNRLISSASGTSGSHQRVKPEDIFNLNFQMRNENQITEFTSTVLTLLDKNENNIKQSETLKNLRDTLLPKLISGEVQIRTD